MPQEWAVRPGWPRAARCMLPWRVVANSACARGGCILQANVKCAAGQAIVHIRSPTELLPSRTAANSTRHPAHGTERQPRHTTQTSADRPARKGDLRRFAEPLGGSCARCGRSGCGRDSAARPEVRLFQVRRVERDRVDAQLRSAVQGRERHDTDETRQKANHPIVRGGPTGEEATEAQP